jgi:hypothetical protein
MTMGFLDNVKLRVRQASPQARSALVSECAERVYPIYEEMWWGSFYVAVRRAIEMGWNFGCGLPIDAALKGRYLEHVQDAVTFYREEATEDALLANPVTVALRVLESMVEDEEQSCLAVARGLLSTLNSAKVAEAMADRHTPRDDNMKRAVAEEEAWQEAALTLIDGWQGVAKRDMFDGIGEKPPDWLFDWRMRRYRADRERRD